MRNMLTRLFWPILKFFETGGDPANYKTSHRVALNIVGGLFIFLSLVSATAAYTVGGPASLIPVIVFLCLGIVAVIVGALGSNCAVARIWGTK